MSFNLFQRIKDGVPRTSKRGANTTRELSSDSKLLVANVMGEALAPMTQEEQDSLRELVLSLDTTKNNEAIELALLGCLPDYVVEECALRNKYMEQANKVEVLVKDYYRQQQEFDDLPEEVRAISAGISLRRLHAKLTDRKQKMKRILRKAEKLAKKR